MAIIKTLDILLRGKTARLKTDLKKGETLVSSFAKRAKKLLLPLTGAISVAGFVSAMRTSFKELDRLGKRAKSLDIPIDELQAFGLAAEITGTDFETLSKALSIMQRRASEAKVGLLTAVRPLEQLGINIKEFNRLGATEQFKLISDRMRTVADQTDKARIAQELFGRAGSEIIPFLKSGNEELDRANALLKRYGISLDSVGVGAIEEANDAWTETKTIIRGIVNLLAVEFAPIVREIAGTVGRLAGNVKGAGKEFIRFMSNLGNPGAALFGTSDSFDKLFTKFPTMASRAFSKGIAEGRRFSSEIADSFKDVQEAAAKTFDEMKKRGQSLADSVRTPLEVLKDEFSNIRELFKGGFISGQTGQRAARKFLEDFQSKLKGAEVNIRANSEAIQRGSQEDLAVRFGRELKSNTDVAEQSLRAEQETNNLLQELINAVNGNQRRIAADIG